MRKELLLVLASSLLVGAGAFAQSDDPFLRSLDRDAPVDRHGLARFMVGVASSLERGREEVAYLRIMASEAVPGEQFAARASAAMEERYETYAVALGAFSRVSRQALDDPGSRQRLYRAMVSGQHACWRLESQINLAESYGANAGQLPGVRASGQACARFGHVVYQPKVTGLIDRALAESRDEPVWARENLELREELKALEQLLEDLRAIDAE